MPETHADPARRSGRPSHPIAVGTLLGVAARAFASGGYDGASLAQIAADAGLRKASLYHHFPTKDALYEAVLGQLVGDLQGLIADAGLDTGDFVSRLDRLGGLVIDYLSAHPSAAKLLVHEMAGGGRYMVSAGAFEVRSTLDLTAAFLEAGMDAGVFRRQDPRHLTLSIVGLHLFAYCAAEVSSEFLRGDLFAPDTVEARKRTVLAQVRALCVATS